MKDEFTKTFQEFLISIVERSPSIIIGTILLLLFIFLGSVLRKVAKARLQKRIEDPLLVNFISRLILLIFVVVGVMIFLDRLGLGKLAGSLLAGAGVSAIILGFAFKDIGENFLAGIFLAFSRPFSIGDVIQILDIKGTVKALNFRNTHIRTFDGKDVFIPNAILIKNPLSNFTRDGLLRYDSVVGLDYNDKIAEAVKLIMNTLKTTTGIEQEGEQAPFLMLEEFSPSTINIRIFYWVNSLNFTGHIAFLRTEIMDKILLALTEGGFSMPANIVELKTYNNDQPIALRMDRGDSDK